MSEIFNEKNMLIFLEKYIPTGETLTAGIHGIGAETHIKQVFGKCVIKDDCLFPDENGTSIEISKSKYSKYDLYIGITQNYLIMSECEEYAHYYEFDDKPDTEGIDIGYPNNILPIERIGNCFPFSDIMECTVKKAWMGSFKCFIKMKDGSTLKLIFPKLGGLGGGMPNHSEYREAIIERLSTISLKCGEKTNGNN